MLFTLSFAIAFSGALMPGPLLAAVISESTKQGFKSGPLIILGHALLEIVMIAFIIYGFRGFINNTLILAILSITGGLVLLYFGISMLVSVPKLSLDFTDKSTKSSNLVVMGITLSFANPYWILWWLTVGFVLLLGAQKIGILALAVFFCGHILADFVWYCIVSFTISKGRRFISLKAYKAIISTCACALIGFGLYFALNAFNLLP